MQLPAARGATSPQVGLEGVISTPCSLCPRCWDVGQRLGRRRQRTKGLTVPNSALSLPQPFLCTSHPVFRFQATYLSNLRGVTPRPRWLLPSPAQLSSQPPRRRRRARGRGSTPEGCLCAAPPGLPQLRASLTAAGAAACWETLSWRLWWESWGSWQRVPNPGSTAKSNTGSLNPGAGARAAALPWSSRSFGRVLIFPRLPTHPALVGCSVLVPWGHHVLADLPDSLGTEQLWDLLGCGKGSSCFWIHPRHGLLWRLPSILNSR